MGGRGGSSATQNRRNFVKSQAITAEQEEAIDFYASGEGMFVNNVLRGIDDLELTADEKATIRTLDGVLTESISGTLYRSVDAEAIFGRMSQSDYENLLDEVAYSAFSGQKNAYSQNIAEQVGRKIDGVKGLSITDKGFVSTTRSETVAVEWRDFTGSSKPVVVKITTGKNTKGKDISNATPRARQAEKANPQKEVLLARNQQFVITNVYGKNGSIYVDAKMR